MFTENEIAALVADERIQSAIQSLKDEFINEVAPFMEISDHDFLSLVLLTPSVTIARANNSISLMEEMALNKKARKYSKGGYFMKADPVVNAMSIFIKHYDDWADRFLEHIKLVVNTLLDKATYPPQSNTSSEMSDEEYCLAVLKAPFILIRLITSFLSNDENEDLVAQRKVLQVEYDAIIDILKRIDLYDYPVVRHHLTKLVIK